MILGEVLEGSKNPQVQKFCEKLKEQQEERRLELFEQQMKENPDFAEMFQHDPRVERLRR